MMLDRIVCLILDHRCTLQGELERLSMVRTTILELKYMHVRGVDFIVKKMNSDTKSGEIKTSQVVII